MTSIKLIIELYTCVLYVFNVRAIVLSTMALVLFSFFPICLNFKIVTALLIVHLLGRCDTFDYLSSEIGNEIMYFRNINNVGE